MIDNFKSFIHLGRALKQRDEEEATPPHTQIFLNLKLHINFLELSRSFPSVW